MVGGENYSVCLGLGEMFLCDWVGESFYVFDAIDVFSHGLCVLDVFLTMRNIHICQELAKINE